jgi:general secretion pathway protein G
VGHKITRRGEDGFTLVEMLVVITIIGLIMALVGPRVLNYLGESKVKAAKIQIESFGSALDLFYLDAGRYPSSAEGLAALAQRPAGISAWNGPYLKGGSVPGDPWGHAYVYRSPGEHGVYDIVSYGADGQEGGTGTAADIQSWTRDSASR